MQQREHLSKHVSYYQCTTAHKGVHRWTKLLYSQQPLKVALWQYYLPYKVEIQYVHFRLHTKYFLLPWKIPEEISRQSRLFHNKMAKWSIYYMKHINIQPSSMEVDWPEIGCLMEVSTMFYICTYCIFTLWAGYSLAILISLLSSERTWVQILPCIFSLQALVKNGLK